MRNALCDLGNHMREPHDVTMVTATLCLQMKALLVSTLSHDVDHRGVNNTFLLKRGDPLATLYGSSTMEFHHYDQTIYMLQVCACVGQSTRASRERLRGGCDIRGALLVVHHEVPAQ